MFHKSCMSIGSMILAVILLLSGVMLIISGCGDEYIYDPENPDFVPPVIDTGPVSVGAQAFVSDYRTSSVAADAKYSNREVNVSGLTITSIYPEYFVCDIIVKVLPGDTGICGGLSVGGKVDVTGLVDEYSVEEGMVPILNALVDVG